MRGVKEIEKVHQRQQPVCSNSNPGFAFLNGLPADGYLRSISTASAKQDFQSDAPSCLAAPAIE